MKSPLSKSGRPERVSRVQIPPFPPIIAVHAIIYCKFNMIAFFISFIWGAIIGLASAIPVGPVGLVCIQRTLAKNKNSGLISGLGSATADACFAIVAAFSIRFIIDFITHNHVLMRVLGALLLIFIGTSSLISKKKEMTFKMDNALRHIDEFLSGFVMTITNPLTAFVFFAGFASISGKVGHSFTISLLFVLGVFLGSCLWWQVLTYITEKLSHKIKDGYVDIINRVFSVLIVIIGSILLMSVLFRYIDII